MRNKSK